MMRLLPTFFLVMGCALTAPSTEFDTWINALRNDSIPGNARQAHDALLELAQFEWDRVEPALRDAFSSDDGQQRQMALMIWLKEQITVQRSNWGWVQDFSLPTEFDSWTGEEFPLMIEALRSDDVWHNAQFSEFGFQAVLNHAGDPLKQRAVDALTKALHDDNFQARQSATHLLYFHHLKMLPEGIEWPMQVFRNWVERLQFYTAYSYTYLHSAVFTHTEQMIPFLMEGLQSGQVHFRTYGAILLAEYYEETGVSIDEWPDAVIVNLCDALRNDDVPANRSRARWFLHEHGDHPRIHAQLQAILPVLDHYDDEWYVVATLLQPYNVTEMYTEILPVWIDRMKDDDDMNGASASRHLHQMEPQYIEAQIHALDDLDWQQSALVRVYCVMNGIDWQADPKHYATWRSETKTENEYWYGELYERHIASLALYVTPEAMEGLDEVPRWLTWNLYHTPEPKTLEQRAAYLRAIDPPPILIGTHYYRPERYQQVEP